MAEKKNLLVLQNKQLMAFTMYIQALQVMDVSMFLHARSATLHVGSFWCTWLDENCSFPIDHAIYRAKHHCLACFPSCCTRNSPLEFITYIVNLV